MESLGRNGRALILERLNHVDGDYPLFGIPSLCFYIGSVVRNDTLEKAST